VNIRRGVFSGGLFGSDQEKMGRLETGEEESLMMKRRSGTKKAYIRTGYFVMQVV